MKLSQNNRRERKKRQQQQKAPNGSHLKRWFWVAFVEAVNNTSSINANNNGEIQTINSHMATRSMTCACVYLSIKRPAQHKHSHVVFAK